MPAVPSTLHTLVVDCPATPGQTVELVLDKNIRTVSIQGYDNTGAIEKACYYSRLQGQTEGDAIDSNRKTVSAGGLLPIVISGKGRNPDGESLFVAGSWASGKVELIISVEPF